MTSTTIILIILFALVILYLVIKSAGKKSSKSDSKANDTSAPGGNGTTRETGTTVATGGVSNNDEIQGEVLAAIFMALHEDQEVLHDYEDTVLTMDRVVRNYSPWNSKFYGLRQVPRR